MSFCSRICTSATPAAFSPSRRISVGGGHANLPKSLDIYGEAVRLAGARNITVRVIDTGFGRALPFGTLRMTCGEAALLRRQSEILGAVFAGGGTKTAFKELDGARK